MKVYVAGFLFSKDHRQVALIRKARPAWQRGKLNGIGGKVEPGEEPPAAMRREFREETGIDVPHWGAERLILVGVTWSVHFFSATADVDNLHELGFVSQPDEPVVVARVSPLPADVIPNLRWIIPMCLDTEVSGGLIFDRDTQQQERQPA